MMQINDRQKRYVAEYLIDLNATQAAIRAGDGDVALFGEHAADGLRFLIGALGFKHLDRRPLHGARRPTVHKTTRRRDTPNDAPRADHPTQSPSGIAKALG